MGNPFPFPGREKLDLAGCAGLVSVECPAGGELNRWEVGKTWNLEDQPADRGPQGDGRREGKGGAVIGGACRGWCE